MSIPANIVEGRSQQSELEFSRYLKIALNSASELEYHLIAARDIGAMREGDFLSLSNQTIEVRKILYGLLARIATGSLSDTPPSDRPTRPGLRWARGMNDVGDVIVAISSTAETPWGAQLWTASGEVIDLGMPPGARYVIPRAINNKGIVVGQFF